MTVLPGFPLSVVLTLLILLISVFALLVLFVIQLVLYFRRRSQSRKLEPALRAALAEKDIRKAAYLCERHKAAPPALVISSMIAHRECAEPSALVGVEEFKRIWLSTAGRAFSKSTRPAEFAYWIRIIVISAPTLSLLLDISRSLKGIDLISGDGSFSLYWALFRGLPTFSFGMFLAVLAFALEQIALWQTTKLKLMSDDVAIEFLVNCVGKSTRRGSTRYQPGSWMSLPETQRIRSMKEVEPEDAPDERRVAAT